MRISRCTNFKWADVTPAEYKPAGEEWKDVTRHTLYKPGESAFEARYFELGIGGYTSFERHRHEHIIVVLQGEGEVRLGNEFQPILPFDLVTIGPDEPHQFRNTGESPFGFLCIVDAQRDRPVLLEPDTMEPLGRPIDSSCEVKQSPNP